MMRDMFTTHPKGVQLKMSLETHEQESTLAMTDMQPILKFQYAMFEMIKRRFPRPEQASNDVSEKLLIKELDREEHADQVALDGLNSDQVKHSEAYQSMMVKYTTRQDQPTRKWMRTHETCSTAMHLSFNLTQFAKLTVSTLLEKAIRLYQKQLIRIIS